MSRFCPSCGSPSAAGALHCSECGATLPDAAAPASPPAASAPGEGPEPRSNTALIVAVAVLATLVVVGIVALVISSRSDEDDVRTGASSTTSAVVTTAAPTTTRSTTSTSTTSTTSTTTTTVSTTATTAVTGPGDVLGQPAGLLCRDLEAKGYSFHRVRRLLAVPPASPTAWTRTRTGSSARPCTHDPT